MTNDKVHNFEREELKQLLAFAAYESFFILDGECYTQIDGVTMWSPLDPTVASAPLCYFEKKWLWKCTVELLAIIYKRYVDSIFVTDFWTLKSEEKTVNLPILIVFYLYQTNMVWSIH